MWNNSLVEKYQLIKIDENNEFLAVIGINVISNKNPANDLSILEFNTEKGKKEIIQIIKKNIHTENPSANIKSFEFTSFNNYPTLIVTYDIIFSDLTLNRIDAYMLQKNYCVIVTLMTDNINDEIFYPQFIEVIENCHISSPLLN